MSGNWLQTSKGGPDCPAQSHQLKQRSELSEPCGEMRGGRSPRMMKNLAVDSAHSGSVTDFTLGPELPTQALTS